MDTAVVVTKAGRLVMKSPEMRVAGAGDVASSWATRHCSPGSWSRRRSKADCSGCWTSMPDCLVLFYTRSANQVVVSGWMLPRRVRHPLETCAARDVGVGRGRMAFPLAGRPEAGEVLWFERIVGVKGEVPCPPFGAARKFRPILGTQRPVWVKDHRPTAGRWMRTCWLFATAVWPKLSHPTTKSHPIIQRIPVSNHNYNFKTDFMDTTSTNDRM